MAKIRKKPKPADPEAKPEQQAQALVPVQPPPPVEYKPPVIPEGFVPCPRTPEEVIHNVIQRQLQDDLANPPAPEAQHPALALWAKIQNARDRGESLDQFKDEAARILSGVEVEEKFSAVVIRVLNLRKLRRQIEIDEAVGKFLHRLAMRGDLTAREALVLKQMNVNELTTTVKALLDRIETPTEAFAPGDLAKMDYTLQISQTTKNAIFEGTTPQGREIIRKITLRARRKIYESNPGK